MKKCLIYAGLAIAAMTACQKEIDQNINLQTTEGITYSFNINDGEWDGVRSSYVEGTGVILAGNENIAVFYDNAEPKSGSTEGFTKALAGEEDEPTDPIKATGSGFSYSFTAPASSISCENWYAIMPYARTLVKARSNSATPEATIQIHSVQYPSATSFDPLYDYLAAKPFSFTSTGENTFSGSIDAFKRLTAPFKLVVKGLDASDKVYAASMKLSTAASGTDGLTGIFNVQMSENAADTKVVSASAIGNGVTAIYPEGLAANGGEWGIWYCVNPTTLVAGATLTVSVVTATKTITREVTLPSDAAITNTKLSQISVNAKGTGFTEQNSIFQDFTGMQAKTAVAMTASDGIERTYNFTSTTCLIDPSKNDKYYDGGAGTPKGIMVSAPTLTNKWMQIPAFTGKKVTKIGLYVHNASGNGTAGLYATNDKVAREAIASADANKTVLFATGGYVEISLPEGCDDFSGKYFQSTSTQEFVAANFFTEDSGEPIEEITDYYEAFDAGKTITIDGKEYNKMTSSTYSCKKMAELATTDFGTAGLLFLDNSETNSFSVSENLNFADGLVVIGRFRDSQPVIENTATGSVYFRPKNNATFKNVTLKSGSSGLFVTANSTTTCNIAFEDCTLIYTGTGGVFRESAAGKYFGNVTLNNCLIRNNGPVITAASAAAASLGKEGTITARNCVFTPAPGTELNDKPVFDLKTAALEPTSIPVAGDELQTVKIIIESSTFYNYKLNSSGGIVSSWTIGGFKFDHNVIYTSAFATTSNNTRVIKTNRDQDVAPDPISISYNWCYSDGEVLLGPTNGNSPKFWNAADHNVAIPTYVNIDNLFSLGNTTIPFAIGYDASKGYLPIDQTVVTNGAGASYDTKYWISK